MNYPLNSNVIGIRKETEDTKTRAYYSDQYRVQQ